MFEAVYRFLVGHSEFAQVVHNKVSSWLDHFLSGVVREKIYQFKRFSNRLVDQLLCYAFSVLFILLIYTFLYYLCDYLWLCYKDTQVGSMFLKNNFNQYMFVEEMFISLDLSSVFSITVYAAGMILAITAATRFIFVNRILYERCGMLFATFLWGIPLAKVLSAFYTRGELLAQPVFDLYFSLFIVPTLLLVHPTMSVVNWLVPELSDLIVNPVRLLRRLEIERELHRVKTSSGNV